MHFFRSISVIAFAMTMALSLPLVAGFFGRLHPALDSFAHFRGHLAVLIILFAVPLLAGVFWRQGLAAIAFGVAAIMTMSGASFLPGLGSVQAAFHPRDEASPVYRLLHMNVRFDNSEPERILSLIGRLRPDVVTLNEVSVMWREKLSLLSSAYPYRIVCEVDIRPGGVAILSLRPFVQPNAARCTDDGRFAVAGIDFGGRPVEIGTLHLPWPWPFDQSHQIEQRSGDLRLMAETAILAGDLNATPWSAAAARIAQSGSMTPVGPVGPSWLHRKLPERLRFAGLPLDQVFSKGGVIVHSARTLETAGSDHLPVLVEFSLKAEEPGEAQTTIASLRTMPED
jgi:endonuclease/exonuclease/phosphatase (EEP) superfamily protein YafD